MATDKEKIDEIVSRMVKYLTLCGWDDNINKWIDQIEAKPNVSNRILSKFLKEIIKDKKLYEYIIDYACNVKSADIAQIEALEDKYKTFHTYDMLQFVKRVPGANVLKWEDKCIERINMFGFNLSCAIQLMQMSGADMQKFQNALIEGDHISYLVDFAAENLPGVDVLAIEDSLIDSLDTNYIYMIDRILEFATKVKGINVRKIEDLFLKKIKEWEEDDDNWRIEKSNYQDVYKFILETPGVNISRFVGIIIKKYLESDRYHNEIHGDNFVKVAAIAPKSVVVKFENAVFKKDILKDILNFAIDVKGANILRFEDYFVKLCSIKNYHTDTGNTIGSICAKFVNGVKLADFNRIQEAVLANRSFSSVKFAHYTQDYRLDVKRFEDLVIDLCKETPEYCDRITEFAMKVRGANINKLENALIEIGDMDEINNFAEKVQNSRILAKQRLHNLTSDISLTDLISKL